MKQIESILQKEMTRKEFLATLGFGMASVFGFSNVVRFLFNKGHHNVTTTHNVTQGYGSSVYGGISRR